MSDNFQFRIVSEGREHFDIAMSLAFSEYETAVGILFNPGQVILFWTKSDKANPLPYPMDCKAASDFVWHWLQTVEYDKEPDHDGSNEKGFEVYNENWGHVGGMWESFVAIKPVWMTYSK